MHPNQGERLVAVFEAAKGILVLLVGFGLLRVVHQDLESVAEQLVRTFHLDPTHRYPRIFLAVVDRFSDVKLWLLAAVALGYAAFRLIEAYGLWLGRRWAEWFAVASGGIYIPLEIYELFHRATWVKAGALALNVAIVAYIGWAMWRSRQGAAIGRT
jgi:uncharacterized membrane protein (DUF2068 family)